jgi:hypothetical protein
MHFAIEMVFLLPICWYCRLTKVLRCVEKTSHTGIRWPKSDIISMKICTSAKTPGFLSSVDSSLHDERETVAVGGVDVQEMCYFD